MSYTFENEDEGAQAVFVYGKNEDKEFVAGSLNWAVAGRHFKLEMCADYVDCFTWSEVNKKSWINEGLIDEKITHRARSDVTCRSGVARVGTV